MFDSFDTFFKKKTNNNFPLFFFLPVLFLNLNTQSSRLLVFIIVVGISSSNFPIPNGQH